MGSEVLPIFFLHPTLTKRSFSPCDPAAQLATIVTIALPDDIHGGQEQNPTTSSSSLVT